MEAELIAELVGFVVMLFVLWKYVLPLVGNMVRKRQDEVQRQVDEAEEATRKLEDARGRLDNAVQRAEAEAARIRDDARAEATRIREELKEQAEAEVERMLQRGREQLVAEREQAVRKLRGELGGASMELAERVIGTTLATTAPAGRPSRGSCPRSRACRRRGAACARRPAEGPSRWRSYCRPPAGSRSPRPPPGSTSRRRHGRRPQAPGRRAVRGAGLLDGEPALRRALADPAMPGGGAQRPRRPPVGGKIGRPALDVVSDLVRSRWSRAVDLVEAWRRWRATRRSGWRRRTARSTASRTSCSGSAGSSTASRSWPRLLADTGDARRQARRRCCDSCSAARSPRSPRRCCEQAVRSPARPQPRLRPRSWPSSPRRAATATSPTSAPPSR